MSGSVSIRSLLDRFAHQPIPLAFWLGKEAAEDMERRHRAKIDAEIAELDDARVKTSNVYPPIPTRKFDWCAWWDGEEELGEYGWGETRDEAVTDLKESYPREGEPT